VHHYRIIIITVIGIIISQVIATFNVYMANIQLANQIQILHTNGYLIVPNLYVLPQLQTLKTAFVGGLFFTGTIGLGMISITLFGSWFWVNVTQKSKIILIVILVQWLIAIYYANINGWSEFSLYLFIMLPSLIFINSKIPNKSNGLIPNPKIFWCVPVLFIIIAGLCTERSVSFISIRDYLLLSNRLGHQLNDLYYQYTLFPGEIIKPFELKQQKTCYIHAESNDSKRYIKSIERKCILYDYLIIHDPKKADVVIKILPPNIIFQTGNKTVKETEIVKFMRKTRTVFSDFSTRTDRKNFFRMCLFLSLTISAPILLYIILMQGLFDIFCLTRIPVLISQCLVMFIMCTGIGQMILQIPPELPDELTQQECHILFKKSYAEKDWRQAVVLLKSELLTQNKNNHDLALKFLQQTDHPVLKYWLIRFLSDSKNVNNVFTSYLSDPDVNVVCQALYALGRQRDKALISPIKTFIRSCPHWYIQMYAYRALKRLGWRNFSGREVNY
jgi:hypothetical protein